MPMNGTKRIVLFILSCLLLLPGCNGAEETVDSSWVVSAGDSKLTPGQFSFFLKTVYNAYEAHAEDMGFSTEKPLNEQLCDRGEKEGYTWRDFFTDKTVEQVKELLLMCAYAKDNGITLDSGEEARIEENVSAIKSAAEKRGMTPDALAEENFGEGVTVEDVRSCLKMQALSGMVKTELNSGEFTDEELENECSQNMGKYYAVDYRHFSFMAADFAEGSEDGGHKEAKAHADALFAAAKDEESFLSVVEKYLREEKGYSEEKIQRDIEACGIEGYKYTTGNEFAQWAFEKNEGGEYIRTKNEVCTFYDTDLGRYTVGMIVRPIYRDDYATRSMRHILISVDSFDKNAGLPEEQALAKANELMDELKADGITEEEFSAMASEHSMDVESAAKGGLFTQIGKRELKEELNDWLFANSRVVGDTEIIKTIFGYHIVYYVGEGPIRWKLTAEQSLRTAAYEKAMVDIQNKYPINVNTQFLGTINM